MASGLCKNNHDCQIHTVVCILVGMKSFPSFIHGAEINDTSYESQADFRWEKTK